MAIRKMQAAEPVATKPVIKRVQKSEAPSTGEFATKDQLQDRLIVLTLKDYDPKHVGNYGLTDKVEVDVIDVETLAKHDGMWFFTNLAKQIAEGLQPGEIGLGTIVSGPTKSGSGSWWGIEWSDSDEDYERAEKALAAASETVPY